MNKRDLYTLCAAIFPFMVCTGIVYSVLPLYLSQELGASPSRLGLIYMAGAGIGAIFAPPLGRLSDRIGRKRVLLFTLLGFALAFALYSLLHSYSQAFPVQALEGASWVALGAVVPALIADITPEGSRGWAMGVYQRTWSLGWMIGPPLGGFLAESVGFRLTFLLGSILVVLGALGLSRLQLPAPEAASSAPPRR